jgi:hypothetical protein
MSLKSRFVRLSGRALVYANSNLEVTAQGASWGVVGKSENMTIWISTDLHAPPSK